MISKIINEIYNGVKYACKISIIGFIASFIIISTAFVVATNYQPVSIEHKRIIEDPRLTFAKLKYSDPEVLKYTYNVPLYITGDPMINAYTNGVAVYITKGLLEYVGSTDELAFILGHELGHIIDTNRNNHIWIGPRSETRSDIIGMYISNQAGYEGCRGAEFMFRLYQDYGDWNSTSHPINSQRALYLACNKAIK